MKLKPRHWKSVRFALMSCALICVPSMAQDLVERDISQKGQNVENAKKHVMEGDAAYGASRYADAVSKYAQAYGLLPDAPITQDLRVATAERYATAAVERAKEMSRGGDVAGALALCEQVLAVGVAPQHAGALSMRDQLQDPIRTNPAVTEAHAKDVDQVRRALYEAEGFFDLGKFDQAERKYYDVLRIDAYNNAARLGLQEVVSAKTKAQLASRDHARAEALLEVEKAWELQPPQLAEPILGDPLASTAGKNQFVAEKMASMIVPNVDLEQVSLAEAVDFLRSQARTLDLSSAEPAAKGINIVVNLGNDPNGPSAQIAARKLDLKVQNVPFATLLQMVCDQVGAKYTTGDYAITVRPLSADVTEIVTRSYRVPPDFFSAQSTAAVAESDDIFAQADSNQESLLPKKMSAIEKLKSLGIPFPEGTFASFNPALGTLTVKNSTDAQDMVQNLVDMAAQIEPVQVNISVKIIKIQNVELEELGTDWLFNELAIGGELVAGGGTVGNGADLNDLTNGALVPAPVTSGLRSGNTSIVPSSIDELIRNGTSGFSASSVRSPGFFSLLGNDLNGSQVAMMMRGFSQKKGVDVMVKPSTMARSGQTSKIEIIREFMYATEYEPPQLPQNVGGGGFIDPLTGAIGQGAQPAVPITPAHPTAFDTRNVGVTLEASPVVSADKKYVELTLKSEVVGFDGFVNYGSPINGSGTTSSTFDVATGAVADGNSSFGELTPNRILMPIFSKIGAETSVSIADGATIVLGGMVEERVQAVEDKVPILSGIPFVGRSFQSKALQPVRTSVLIMVTVDLQDPSGRLYRDR